MKKRLCPACKVSTLYIMNSKGDRLSIYVDENYTIIPKDNSASMDGFDTDTIYCYGCSWSGSVKRLI
ncbi:MAG: hypothetical protein ACRCZM_09610 [Bacteroidales bacterium]